MVNIPHSQQKASATPRKEGADLLTYFGHEAVGIHHQCFFFAGGGLAKGCEKSRDLRSNLKVDPGPMLFHVLSMGHFFGMPLHFEPIYEP